jgi:hypothetical protein
MRWNFMWFFLSCALLSACDQFEQCQNGYKIKREYRTILYNDIWHKNPEDKLLDGATRVSTSTSKDARAISIRCFKHKGSLTGFFDLRYEISVPLLARAVEDIEKAGEIELVISVDGTSIGSSAAHIAKHDFGISFLGSISPSTLEKLAAAQEKIIVMPRQQNKSQDEVIEFGVAELYKHIMPVKSACKEAQARERVEVAFQAGDYTKAVELQAALEQAIEKIEMEKDGKPGPETASELLGLSWYQLFAKQLQAALETSNRATALAPGKIIFAMNSAHAMMFLGRAEEARALHLKYKGQRIDVLRGLWEEEVLNDFAKLEAAGLTHPQMAAIRAALGRAKN